LIETSRFFLTVVLYDSIYFAKEIYQ
jgi:hypothetical protein